MSEIAEKQRSDEGIGNPETWVDLYADSLFCYALLRIADKGVAEELVQETFVAALSTLGNSQFRGESAGKTWLTGILKHKISDHLRKKYRHQAQSFEDINNNEIEDSFDVKGNWRVKPGLWGMEPHKRYEQQEFMAILANCISGLGARQADAFRLRELDGEQSEEICKVLNISPTNYWVLMHRARLAMRRCIERYWPFDSQRRTTR